MAILDDIRRHLAVAMGNQEVAKACADRLMGDTQNTIDLTALSPPASTDLVAVVDDPTGTPVLKKSTLDDVVLAGGGTITKKYTFDCSGGGEDVTEDVITLPAGDLLHNVSALVDIAFDAVDNKCEVGVSGNLDKYIDQVDFDPSSDGDFQAMTGGGSNDQGSLEYIASETTIQIQWTNGDFTVFTGTGTGTGDDTGTGTGTNDVTAGQIIVYVTYSRPVS